MLKVAKKNYKDEDQVEQESAKEEVQDADNSRINYEENERNKLKRAQDSEEYL